MKTASLFRLYFVTFLLASTLLSIDVFKDSIIKLPAPLIWLLYIGLSGLLWVQIFHAARHLRFALWSGLFGKPSNVYPFKRKTR